jgi:hypothetical protein
MCSVSGGPITGTLGPTAGSVTLNGVAGTCSPVLSQLAGACGSRPADGQCASPKPIRPTRGPMPRGAVEPGSAPRIDYGRLGGWLDHCMCIFLRRRPLLMKFRPCGAGLA